MNLTIRASFVLASMALMPAFAQEDVPQAQDPETDAAQQVYSSLNFEQGPGTFDVTPFASIELPEGYDRLDPTDTRKLMELFQNPTYGEEYYVGPVDERWFAIFTYEDTGHVKDDEEIDPDALLDSIRSGTREGNRVRRERGWSEMEILGWQYEPAYNENANRMSWAVLAESDGVRIVNYNTRLLGRTGVISAVLVADPEGLDTSVEEFESLLGNFSYKPGNTYAEYEPGDKLATYGLAALVTGGAAVAVAKGAGKGLFKAIGFGIIAFFALLWGRIKKMITSKKNA